MQWITSINLPFKAHDVENNVAFASQRMKGRTTLCWDNALNLMTNPGISRDWEHFNTSFLDKYFPSSLRTQKEYEFQQLRQGNISVTGYVEKFENMIVYSRKVMYASNEKWKMDKFMYGLRGDIAHSVSQREFITYGEILRQCYVAESSLKKIQTKREEVMQL